MGATVSPLVSQLAWGAEGPGGLPMARPDKPVTMPMNGNPIGDGMKPESGTFTVFNYADYLYKDLLDQFGKKYGVDVQITTFENMDQCITKLANNSVDVDVTEITPDRLSQAVAGKLLQPINHGYIPNLEKNVWPQLQSPFYDQESRYTVPYTCYTTGIGWRSDKVKEDIAHMDNPWSIFWNAQAYQGLTGIIQSPREAIGMAMLYRGNTDLNTEDPKVIDQALEDLKALVGICNPKVDQTQYQTLPQGTSVLHQAWSGDLLTGAMWYMPEGQSPDNLQYWQGGKGKAPVQNDCWAVPAVSKRPVLAHLWMNFILDNQNAYDNFINFTGYQPPINSFNPDRLISEGTIPKHLASAVVKPDDLGPGSIQYMTLTAKGQKMWQDAYAQFIAGV
jgi:spermidine/putrescine transport system substrate-binding protein